VVWLRSCATSRQGHEPLRVKGDCRIDQERATTQTPSARHVTGDAEPLTPAAKSKLSIALCRGRWRTSCGASRDADCLRLGGSRYDDHRDKAPGRRYGKEPGR